MIGGSINAGTPEAAGAAGTIVDSNAGVAGGTGPDLMIAFGVFGGAIGAGCCACDAVNERAPRAQRVSWILAMVWSV